MRRIAVMGSSGAGKTTLATALAQRLNLTHIELDALYHLSGWAPRETASFRAVLIEAMESAPNGWVMCGGYTGKVGDLRSAHADTIVILDYPRWFIMSRFHMGNSRRWWQPWTRVPDRWWQTYQSVPELRAAQVADRADIALPGVHSTVCVAGGIVIAQLPRLTPTAVVGIGGSAMIMNVVWSLAQALSAPPLCRDMLSLLRWALFAAPAVACTLLGTRDYVAWGILVALATLLLVSVIRFIEAAGRLADGA